MELDEIPLISWTHTRPVNYEADLKAILGRFFRDFLAVGRTQIDPHLSKSTDTRVTWA